MFFLPSCPSPFLFKTILSVLVKDFKTLCNKSIPLPTLILLNIQLHSFSVNNSFLNLKPTDSCSRVLSRLCAHARVDNIVKCMYMSKICYILFCIPLLLCYCNYIIICKWILDFVYVVVFCLFVLFFSYKDVSQSTFNKV